MHECAGPNLVRINSFKSELRQTMSHRVQKSAHVIPCTPHVPPHCQLPAMKSTRVGTHMLAHCMARQEIT